MNKQKILTSLVSLSILAAPVLALAQPSGNIGSIEALIDVIEKYLWIVFGLIAVIAFVVAGILFLTAGGDPEKVKQARTAFIWGVVGVIVGILAFSIVQIIDTAV